MLYIFVYTYIAISVFLQQYVFECEMFCPFQWIRRKETKKSWGSLGEKQVWIRLKDLPLAAMFTDLDFSSPKFDFLFISLSQRRWCKCNISSAKIPSEMEVAPRFKLLTQASTLQTETLFFLLIFPLKGVSSHNLNRPN